MGLSERQFRLSCCGVRRTSFVRIHVRCAVCVCVCVCVYVRVHSCVAIHSACLWCLVMCSR